jgi:hypothetical protein
MEKPTTYERFPVGQVVLCGLFTVAIYALGAYILAGFGAWAPIVYVGYCLWIEFRILQASCANCYYYGKLCGLGRGVVCALLFKKGDPDRFLARQPSWRDVLPDMLVVVLPIVGGIVLLVRDFSWTRLGVMIVLLALYFAGNALTRGAFACKHCKQRELGCPAQELFQR